ncbi:signal peptidase I [Xylanibacillus composti]|uniref:Signal peptidase I n=1 Tax=Xylanibacillus composti TaxID=1572762 RepID=A0A8J4H1J6_9BACL|nr:signal peptidase I [Xylanibacillus composti]MDT9725850.1 signal peptidase I [Xylanibacillus composti]GIQ69194.1 signal peptidase I S [Xylanibacillus composti]
MNEQVKEKRGLPDPGSKLMRELWDWGKSIVAALLIVMFVHQFVFSLSIVEGQSMEPTLQNEERLFVNRALYYWSEPDRGDIVVLKDPRENSDLLLVKRVIGVPGDTIEVKDGRLYVNDEVYYESYVDTMIEDGDVAKTVVPEGEYFVMGDNRHRSGSLDSRIFGSVQKKSIIGRAEFIVWPITHIGGL